MTNWTRTTLLALVGLALMALSSAQECDVEEVFCALPEVVDAGSTRSIRFNASHLIQGFEICKGNLAAPFRTADGTCNNVFNWGAAARPPRRLLPNAYDDGVNAPRIRDAEGFLLPSAAQVSRVVHRSSTEFQGFSIMLMQWGQFIDHDITGFPISSEEDESIRCCGEFGEQLRNRPDKECFPIRLSANDDRFNGTCMEFARSVAARDKLGKKMVPREQINSVTSFIDGSMIYGSNQTRQNALRQMLGPNLGSRLRTSPVFDLLPDNGEEDCIHEEGEFCFFAGDTRVNEQPGLQAIHTLFVRVHNNIADELELRRPNDDRETIFQLTRKILIAIIQNIHYGEWLPLIIGRQAMHQFGIKTGKRSSHAPGVDPRITNAFSTAAFRFGHSLIPDELIFGDQAFPLRELFGRTSFLFQNFNNVLLSLTKSNNNSVGAQRFDRFFTEEVTGHLFETPDVMENEPSNGLDLVALNIQRGRDHGIPAYNLYRQMCGLPVLKNFFDLPRRLARLYKRVYRSVDDIDLFSGLMTEESVAGGIVGPTLTCLLGNQFHALKYGDRFYFETNSTTEGFTDAQLDNIREITMAHVCCQEKGIPTVQKDLFLIGTANDTVLCDTLRDNFINFTLWENFT